MKGSTPYVISACVVAYLAIDFASSEYSHIRNAIGETKAKTDAVADETKETIEAIKQTIEDLRAKFITLETQLAASEPPKQAKQTKQTKPTIVMHTTTGCPPCEEWKRIAKPAWESVGWQVTVLPPEPFVTRFPWFEIIDTDGVKFKSVGYLTKETFERDKALAERQGATIE